jgi:hypothetical protein
MFFAGGISEPMKAFQARDSPITLAAVPPGAGCAHPDPGERTSSFSFSFRKKVSESEIAFSRIWFSVILDRASADQADALGQQHPNPYQSDPGAGRLSGVGTTLSAAILPSEFRSSVHLMVAAGEPEHPDTFSRDLVPLLKRS